VQQLRQCGTHAVAILGRELSQHTTHKALIEGKEFASHDRRSGQAGSCQVTDGQSSGQGALAAEVIMASTTCPEGTLNFGPSESTSEGRFLVAVRSVKGKGTRSTM